MRLVMLGTGPFAVPTFRLLGRSRHVMAGLVTQPIRPGSEKAGASSPMRAAALELRIPVFDPEKVNSAEGRARLLEWAPELLVVCDFGQILSARTLGTARLGGVNLHGSLLPQYRGAAPVNWAIYDGQTETGVTVIHMTPQVDAGPCLAREAALIDPDESAVELEARLATLGAPLVASVIDAFETGTAVPLPQDDRAATGARRLQKADGAIDWTRPAFAIKNQVRALEPWPKTYCFWNRPQGASLRLILGTVQAAGDARLGHPGEILDAGPDTIRVATGVGALVILTLQPAGKRMLTAAEFLRGYPLAPHDRLA